jgi:hypothetical protein
MSIRERDAGWSAMLGVPAALSAFFVVAQFVWPIQQGRIVSHERRRIDARERGGEKQDQHASDGGGPRADELGAGRVTSDEATSR